MNNICAQFWQSQIMGTSGTIKFASTRRAPSSREAVSTDEKVTYVDRSVTETFQDVKRPYAVSKFDVIHLTNKSLARGLYIFVFLR